MRNRQNHQSLFGNASALYNLYVKGLPMFGRKIELPEPTQSPPPQPRLLSCGHSKNQTVSIDGRKSCSVCLEGLNLSSEGLDIQLIQTETKRQVLLFVHKRQTMADPESHELLARAPTPFPTAWEKNSDDYWNWRTANIGMESLMELFYGRPITDTRGVLFHDVQKYIGEGKVVYLQSENGHVAKLAEIYDENRIKLTPYATKTISQEGFYGLKVTYEPAIQNGQAQSWYETLRQEGSEHTDPEIEVLIAPA